MGARKRKDFGSHALDFTLIGFLPDIILLRGHAGMLGEKSSMHTLPHSLQWAGSEERYPSIWSKVCGLSSSASSPQEMVWKEKGWPK